MAVHDDPDASGEGVEKLEAENESLRRQVFRAESVIADYRRELDAQGFELKKLKAELKLQAQLSESLEK